MKSNFFKIKTVFLLLSFLLMYGSSEAACDTPQISGSRIVCQYDTVVYATALSPGYTYLWKFSGGKVIGSQNEASLKIVFADSGMFAVTVVVTDTILSCSDSAKIQVTVNDVPEPYYVGLKKACLDAVAPVSPFDDMAAYFWDFGDGFTSTKKSVTHYYTKGGTYKLIHGVRTKSGCYIQFHVSDIEVHELPDTKFTTNILDSNGTVEVIAQDTSLTEYRFIFGDFLPSGCDKKSYRCVHKYQSSGKYKISLNYTDEKTHCSSFSDTTIQIQLPVNIQSFEAFPMSFTVFPNPFSTILQCEFQTEKSHLMQVVITDLSGRQLYGNNLQTADGTNRFSVDAAALQFSPGMYLLMLKSEGKTLAVKKIMLLP